MLILVSMLSLDEIYKPGVGRNALVGMEMGVKGKKKKNIYVLLLTSWTNLA